MKTNTILIIVVAIVLLLVIGYAVYAYNKRKEEEIEAQLRTDQLNLLTDTGPRPGESGFWTIAGKILPFLI